MGFFQWSQQCEVVRRGCCRVCGGLQANRFSERQDSIFREKNVKRSSHFETHTRKVCDGFELEKGRGDGSFDGIPLLWQWEAVLGVFQLCRAHWIGLLAHLCVCLHFLSHITAKHFFPQSPRLRKIEYLHVASSGRHNPYRWISESKILWLFRTLLSGCNNTELSLKALLNL